MKLIFWKLIFPKFLMFLFVFAIANSQSLIANRCLYAADVLFESFDDLAKFKMNKAPQAWIKTGAEPGRTGNALRIDYDLTKDHFVEIGAPASIDLNKVKDLRWWMKGDLNGSVFEIKFVDTDGSTFGKKLPVSTVSKEEWKQFTLPMKECHYMWGGDQKIDRIKEFYIAVSRGQAKKGYVILDSFTYTPKLKGNVDFEISVNQVGYHPTDKKFFVVRVQGADNDRTMAGAFSVQETIDGTTVFSGNLQKSPFSDWPGIFFTGDFSSVDVPGKYSIKVKLQTKDGPIEKTSYSFNINNSILSAMTLAHELNYLDYQRCGIKCHKQDPVMGGWHDTLFDISKRMWSIPSLVYGLARYVQDAPVHAAKTPEGGLGDFDELVWGLKFCAGIADADGAVPWGGIEADFQKSMTYEQFIARIGPLKPEDDLLPRIRYPEKNFHATAFNLVALVNAIPAVKQKDGAAAAKAEAVVNKAWEWLDKQPLNEARDYGAYLWAATELYKFNSNRKFLYRVNEVAPKLLQLQALNFRQFENNACGDFYTSKNMKDFRFQYKYVSFNIAINLALLNLAEILTPDDQLWFDVYYADYVFGENFIKGKAMKTPYRQIAVGLESDKPKTQVATEWQIMNHKGVTASLDTTGDGKNGAAVIDFVFNEGGEWTQIFKPVAMSLEGLENVSFEYKYSGDPNNLELKITDDSDSNFGAKLELGSGGWTEEEIPAANLEYFWGNNTRMNYKGIKQLWFALAKKDGGKGTLSLRNLKFNMENGTSLKIPMATASNDAKYALNYFAGPEAEQAAAPNHGLNCDHLGIAYVAMKTGYLTDDVSFEELADNQVNWVLGNNPLNYCMLIGAGSENPIIMSEYFAKPKLNGIIPNGIVGGLKDNPEWWGDGPSSGEDWMPHNAAYFAALSLLDSQGQLQGKILLNGEPHPNATIEVRESDKPVTRTISRAGGLFGPITLPPQKNYKLVIYDGDKSIVRDIALLSGEKQKVTYDLSRNYDIDMRITDKVETGRKTQLSVAVSKNALGKQYKILVKGAKMGFPAEGMIQSENTRITLIPDGDKPIMVVFLIKGNPPVYKTYYLPFTF